MAGLQRGIQTHQGDYRKRLQPEPGVGLEPTTFSLQEKITRFADLRKRWETYVWQRLRACIRLRRFALFRVVSRTARGPDLRKALCHNPRNTSVDASKSGVVRYRCPKCDKAFLKTENVGDSAFYG